PVVEICRMTPKIDHAVDGAGAADHVAPRNRDSATVQVLLRRGHEAPVEAGHRDPSTHRLRNMDERVPVHRTRFDQGNANVTVFGQTTGEYASRGTGPDNHIIK